MEHDKANEMYKLPLDATLEQIQALLDAMCREPEYNWRGDYWKEKYRILCDRETELIKVRNAANGRR